MPLGCCPYDRYPTRPFRFADYAVRLCADVIVRDLTLSEVTEVLRSLV